jgi:hypothetical protein
VEAVEEYEPVNEVYDDYLAVDLQDMEGRDPQRARFIKGYLKRALV